MEAQSESSEDVAMEVPEARFLKSFIAVCKENRDVLSRLPEMIESLIANEEHLAILTEAHQFEEYRKSKEKELIAKEKTLEETDKQLKVSKEEDLKFKTQLQEKKKELSKKNKEITKREKDILETTKQNEEKLRSKEAEIQRMKEEFSKDLEEYRKRLTSKEAEIQEMRDGYSKDLEEYKKSNDAMRKEIEAKDKQIKQHLQSMSKMNDELKTAHERMDRYKSRLASLSEKRLKQDQRLVEDTLGSNRQSELERDFFSFFDDERMDACEKMLSIYQNKDDDFMYVYYPRLACIILETAYEQAIRAKEAGVDLFKELTKRMIDCAAEMGKCLFDKRELHKDGEHSNDTFPISINCTTWGERSEYPKDAMDGILLSLKETAENCNLNSLMEGFLDIVATKWGKWCEEDKSCVFTPAFHLLKDLDLYIKACFRLSWRMVTQLPPMILEYQSTKFNKDIHKKLGYRDSFKLPAKTHSSAEQNQEEDIVYYLWPGLKDGGGRIIRPGEVLCRIIEQERTEHV